MFQTRTQWLCLDLAFLFLHFLCPDGLPSLPDQFIWSPAHQCLGALLCLDHAHPKSRHWWAGMWVGGIPLGFCHEPAIPLASPAAGSGQGIAPSSYTTGIAQDRAKQSSSLSLSFPVMASLPWMLQQQLDRVLLESSLSVQGATC